MSIPASFLDEVRARTTLSALIGRTVKLAKAGREHKACCPFHQEKTPSFHVNDEKGFYHCFGCQAHGDAIRWLTEQGMGFLDAVRELADAAGLAVPAPTPEAERREAARAGAAELLEPAAHFYAEQLRREPKVLAALAERGVDAAAIARFGIGWAPPRASVTSAFSGAGVAPDRLEAAGLLVKDERSGLWRDRFAKRIMIPCHDSRGRVCGFSGRIHGAPGGLAVGAGHKDVPKYLNSPESGFFRKGELLFNLHRAAEAYRRQPPSAGARPSRRLVIVEGQFDAIALDRAGIGAVAAPMGTALTEGQLERAWRISECPVLLMDGDRAGQAAARRAAERALPFAGPGRSLRIAALPAGEDPDSLVRAGGREAIEAAIEAALPLDDWLWTAIAAELDDG